MPNHLSLMLFLQSPLLASQHAMAYPSVYPLSRPIVATHSLPAGSPSRSIHVGAPSVNIDVQTTRHRIAHHNLEKQVSTLFFFTYTSAQIYKISILI